MNKKIVAVIAVVVAIVVIVGGVIGGYIYHLSSQKIGLKDILVSLDKKTNGIEVGIITVPKEFSGTATLDVSYNEISISTDTIEIKNGEGKKTIPYTDFVTENGNYTFEVTFKDKTKTKMYTVYGIVTEISVYANAKLDGTEPKIEVSVWPDTVAPLGSASVTITQVDDGVLVNAESLTLSATTGIYSGTFSYINSGYYTIHAEMVNPVKSGGAYENITDYVRNQTGGDNVLINLEPEAGTLSNETYYWLTSEHEENHEEDGNTEDAIKVEFDATDLLAEDYDGGITYYEWDLGYNWSQGQSVEHPSEENGTNDARRGINVTYWYPSPEHSTKEYIIKLCIHDAYTVIVRTCKITVIRV
jgi:hypothetical protein